VPAGNVQFKIDGLNAGVPVPLSGGVASLNAGLLPAGLYAVSAQYSGNSNFHGATNQLASPLLVNTPPIAAADTIFRPDTNGTKVAIAELLSNDSDADGHALTWISFSAVTPNGGAVSRSGDWIFYAPSPGFVGADEFTYVIQDALGVTATGVVQIAVHENTVPSPNLVIESLGQGEFLLSFDGIPGKTYRIQYAEDLELEAWMDLGTETANEAGMFQFFDAPGDGAPQRYYRSVYP
jgi:hypothetical protein